MLTLYTIKASWIFWITTENFEVTRGGDLDKVEVCLFSGPESLPRLLPIKRYRLFAGTGANK